MTFDPTSPGTPTPTTIDSTNYLDGVACPSTSQCTAVDGDGQQVTFDPTSPGTPTPTTIDSTNTCPGWRARRSRCAWPSMSSGMGSWAKDRRYPANSSPPTISGSVVQGQTLTEGHGSWTNSPIAFSYQWEDCDSSGNNCSAIAGATGQTYTLTSSDVGDTIRVLETASNASGASSPASSVASAVVVPAPPPPPPGSVSSASGSSTTPGGTASASNAGTSVNAVGEGSLTVSQYGSDPVGQPAFSAAGEFFDVALASGSSFTGLTITDCNLNGGTSLQWWNGSAWIAVSPQSYSAGPPACVTATLGTGSSPTIAQLTGTVFAVAKPSPGGVGVARVDRVTVAGATASVSVSCAGVSGASCTATLTLTATGTIRSGKVTAVTAAKNNPAKAEDMVVVLGSATVTLTAGQSKTVQISLNATGKRLLAERRTLEVKLTLTQSGKSTVYPSAITFKAKPITKSHKH